MYLWECTQTQMSNGNFFLLHGRKTKSFTSTLEISYTCLTFSSPIFIILKISLQYEHHLFAFINLSEKISLCCNVPSYLNRIDENNLYVWYFQTDDNALGFTFAILNCINWDNLTSMKILLS